MPESILQWNIRGMTSAKEDILKIINDFKPSILSLQETFYGNDFMIKLHNYNGLCKQGHFNHRFQGGVALYIHSSHPFSPLQITTDFQVVAARVHMHHNRTVTVASIYLPPRHEITENALQNIIDQLPTPFMLLGDFNAHHTSWDQRLCDARGRLIHSCLSNNNLLCLNTIIPTHISGSSVDLSLCSAELGSDVEWHVLPSVLSSDHYPILLTLTRPPTVEERPPARYNYKKANWNEYKTNNLFHEIPHDFENKTPTVIYNDIMKRLKNAADCSIPIYNPECFYPRPQWNSKCDHAWRERERLYRRYKDTGNIHIKTQWQRARAIAKQIFKQSKKDSFNEYLSSMRYSTPISQIYSKLRNIRGRHTPQIHFLHHMNTTYCSSKDIVNCLGSVFASISNYDNHSQKFQQIRNIAEQQSLDFSSDNTEAYNKPFSIVELNDALATCPDTSPGPDAINFRMLKELPEVMHRYLLYMFNLFWRTGFFPDQWRKANVMAFLKPNKPSHDPSSYRPIALTSCLCKLLEKMINRRLVEYLELNKLITNIQCGFRKSRSTCDHLVRLDTYLRKSLAQSKIAVGIFFDIQKAYDTTWRYGILRDLYQTGMRGRLPSYVQEFLNERRFSVVSNNTISDEYSQLAGVPQGSILSVTLFSLKINSLAKILPSDVHSSLFVDDLQLSYSGYDMESINQKLQPLINQITDWADLNGFTFSTVKTHCMVFHKQPSYPVKPHLSIYGNKIPVKDSVKFLGLHWDSQLNWKIHINHLKASCNKSLNLLRTLSSNAVGADQYILLQTYKLIVRPKIDYGCNVYGSAAGNTLRELDSIHNEALRICTGAFRSTPVESLYILCSEPSLSDRRDDMLCRYYYKMKCHLNNPARSFIHSDALSLFFSSRNYKTTPIPLRIKSVLSSINLPTGPVLPFKTPNIYSWELLRPKTDMILAVSGVKEILDFSHIFNSYVDEKYAGYKQIYTDGSKTDTGVGAAAVFNSVPKSATLPSIASIYSAELYAIRIACEQIMNDSNDQINKYLICSDSLSAVQNLSTSNPTNQATYRLQLLLHEILLQNIDVVVLWIPGHSNVIGNERADRAACKASSGIPTFIPIPYTDFFPLIKKAIHSRWQSRWENNDTQLRQIKSSPLQWNKLELTRKQEVILNRLRLGHTRLTHSYLMENNIPIRPPCPWCANTALSIEHILISCNSLKPRRLFSFSNAKKNSKASPPSWAMNVIL